MITLQEYIKKAEEYEKRILKAKEGRSKSLLRYHFKKFQHKHTSINDDAILTHTKLCKLFINLDRMAGNQWYKNKTMLK